MCLDSIFEIIFMTFKKKTKTLSGSMERNSDFLNSPIVSHLKYLSRYWPIEINEILLIGVFHASKYGRPNWDPGTQNTFLEYFSFSTPINIKNC